MAGKIKRKVFFTVSCHEHGRVSISNRDMEVRVGTPAHKRDQQSGCPVCHKTQPKEA